MVLMAAMTGATVFSFEPEWDLWSSQPNGHVGAEVIWPLLQRVVEQRLVATKEEVLAHTHVAYQLRRSATLADFHAQIDDVDPVSGEGGLRRR